MKQEKTAAEIYYEMIDRCEKRTLEFLRRLIIEKTYEDNIRNKKIKTYTKRILINKKDYFDSKM